MILLPLILLLAARPSTVATWDDEFVGPFPSWANLKADYGAIGDGIVDDTAALQSALDEVGTAGHSPILYLPPGTYRVTSTLRLTSRIHVSIIGANPATTTVRWTGASGGILATITGMAYSRINRLTFDGSGRASVLIDQAWDCQSPYFDTGNEYADDVFRNAGTGIRGGNLGCGFAETSVWRSQFVKLTTAGIALRNFNALDLWVWYSRFDYCNVGVTNDPGAGNFHVYNSVFRYSTTSDLYMKNTGGFNIRNNTSIGSKAFFRTLVGYRYPAYTTLQGNTIKTSGATPIVVGNQGPVAVIDNVIASAPGAPPVAVGYNSFVDVDGDALLVGNTFTSSVAPIVKGRSFVIDTTIVPWLSVSEPPLPPTPPGLGRTVFEVPPGADAATIQQAIDNAYQVGQRAVVHLPAADYAVAATLQVPAGADIQIVGDGQTSALTWTGGAGGPVLRLNGPTRVILRDFSIHASSTVEGIALAGADQPGGRLFLDQAQVGGGAQANVLADAVDYLVVDARDIGHGPSAGASVSVIGGPLAGAGAPQGAAVNIFSGASCCNTGSAYSVSNGGSLLVRDIWYEFGTASAPYLTATGNSIVTVSGARVAQPASPPAFALNDFHGLATFLSGGVDAKVSVTGSANGANVFGSGVAMALGVSPYLSDTSNPKGQVAFQHMRMMTDTGSSTALRGIGVVTPAWLRQMLAQTRLTQPQVIGQLPNGVTDVRMYRVAIGQTSVGLHITP